MARAKLLALALQIILVLFLCSSSSSSSSSLSSFNDGRSRALPPNFLPKLPPWFGIAVEGVIYCKSCKLKGYVRSMDASPVPGAVARLLCHSQGHTLSVDGTTDSNGYFLIQTSKVTGFMTRECKVVIHSSPLRYCDTPIYAGDKGSTGASLKFERVLAAPYGLQGLYSAGVLLLVPDSVIKCPP